MATSRACAPSCRSRSIRRISAAPVSRASARVCDSWRTRRVSSAFPAGASIELGQQAVGAEQPRGRRHPRHDDREAQHRDDRLGVPGEGGRRDRRRQRGYDEGHRAHPDRYRGRGGQDPPDEDIHRHPEQVPPGGPITEHPPEPLRAAEPRVGAAARRTVGIGDRHAAPLARQPPGHDGDPAQARQYGRREDPAENQPGRHYQHQEDQRALSVWPALVLNDERHAQRGQAERRQHRQHQAEAGQHQAGERQPPHGGR